MQTSWIRILEFDGAVARQLRACGLCGRNASKPSRFTYALERVIPQIGKLGQKREQRHRDIEIDHCETTEADGKGDIRRDSANRLIFTKANWKRCEAAKLADDEKLDYEFEPHLVTAVPEDLEDRDIQAFRGFVISDILADELRDKREKKFTETITSGDNSNADHSTAV